MDTKINGQDQTEMISEGQQATTQSSLDADAILSAQAELAESNKQRVLAVANAISGVLVEQNVEVSIGLIAMLQMCCTALCMPQVPQEFRSKGASLMLGTALDMCAQSGVSIAEVTEICAMPRQAYTPTTLPA